MTEERTVYSEEDERQYERMAEMHTNEPEAPDTEVEAALRRQHANEELERIGRALSVRHPMPVAARLTKAVELLEKADKEIDRLRMDNARLLDEITGILGDALAHL